MKYTILALVTIFILTLEAQAGAVRIGLIPGNGHEMKDKAEQFASLLSKQIKKDVSIFIPDNYQGLVTAMSEKRVDFAFFTAMSFVYAEKEANAKVLLKSVWDNPYYFSTIVSHPDSEIHSLADLKGKKIAFVDTKSTSGFLMPSLKLKQAGLDYQEVFSGNHKASVEKLMKREVDAIAVFANDDKASKGAWNVYFDKGHFQPKVLWVSQPLPTDPFTVREDFYKENQELTYDVMFALMDMPKLAGKTNLLYETLGVKKLITANTAQYRAVKKLVKQLELKQN